MMTVQKRAPQESATTTGELRFIEFSEEEWNDLGRPCGGSGQVRDDLLQRSARHRSRRPSKPTGHNAGQLSLPFPDV